MNAPKRHNRGMNKTSGSGAGLANNGKTEKLTGGNFTPMKDQFGEPLRKTKWGQNNPRKKWGA